MGDMAPDKPGMSASFTEYLIIIKCKRAYQLIPGWKSELEETHRIQSITTVRQILLGPVSNYCTIYRVNKESTPI